MVGAESIFGPKEDVKALLEAFGIKEGDKGEDLSSAVKQYFIKVPGVGEVTMEQLYVDDFLKEASEGIFDLEWTRNFDAIDNISWYDAMLLADALHLQLLSSRDYWKCLDWAMDHDEHFARSLKEVTWTSTLVVWDRRTKLAKHLLESLGYSGNLPVVVENPEVVPDGRFEDGYRIEGGRLTKPTEKLLKKDGWFEFGDLSEDAGLPTELRGIGSFGCWQGTNKVRPVACGLFFYPNESYGMVSEVELSHAADTWGFFCKNPVH